MIRFLTLFFISISTLSDPVAAGYQICFDGPNVWNNNIPPRYQWNNNSGYCGEVSLISAGLYYGQYISQYDARALTAKHAKQNNTQLLLGANDQTAAFRMHLQYVEWNTVQEQSTHQFLAWVKQNVVKGYPVAIGVYTNEYRFYNDTDPNAGDRVYDHIVPVTGVASNHSLSDPNYYGDDVIYFNDNGLWGDSCPPQYYFSYECDAFQSSRTEANAEDGAVYSLCNNATNYGIAITGIKDLGGDTLPVRVDTNLNYEKPGIKDGSNIRPASMPLYLIITVSDLQTNTPYVLYRYNNLEAVPDSQFNAHADDAYESWQFQISSGSIYQMTQQINSDEVAVYRTVRASAP